MEGGKTICWIQHASEWPLNVSVARVLEEHGISSVFVCKTRTVYEKYKKEGFESYFVSDGVFNYSKRLSDNELKDLDLKYGPPGIRAIRDSDVQLLSYFGDRHSEHNQVIGQTYLFWERFFSEHSIDAFITPETATFLTRTAYNIARQRNISFGQLVIGPSQTSFVVDDVDESHVWSGLLEELEKGVWELSERECALVDDFTDNKIKESQKGLSLRFVPLNFFISFKQYLGLWLHDTAKLRHTDPVRAAGLRYGRKRRLKKLLWKYVTQPFFSYDMPSENDQFVYFPVYSGEETNYLVNDHYWARNEMQLIKEVAQSLPVGHKLYIKEHPFNPGDLTYAELKELSAVSNIKVLHPSVSSHSLIEKSDAVFVLQGTTGWEAFLAKKPVIVMGKTFFAYSSLVHVVKDPTKLSLVLWEAINRGSAVYTENEDEWLWFIYCVALTCGKGMTVRHWPPYGFVDDRENAESIAEYIISHLLKEND